VPGADNLNVRGGVVVPLYSGGRTPAVRDAAQAGVRAARHGELATQTTLAWEVARTFHTVQKARSIVRAAEAAVGSFTTNAALARKRFEAGTLLKSEVLDVEVRLAQAREDLVRARNAASLATRALRSLLGLEEGDFTVSDAVPEVEAPAGGTALDRSELRAAEEGERAAEARVREARAGYRPRLSAFAEATYDHGWRFNGGGDSYAAGAAIEWDLWDGQLTRGRVSEARAGAGGLARAGAQAPAGHGFRGRAGPARAGRRDRASDRHRAGGRAGGGKAPSSPAIASTRGWPWPRRSSMPRPP
jgi:outer membrane protein